METETVSRLLLRLPADVLKRVKRAARAETRTTTQQIVQMLREALVLREHQ